MSRKFQIPLFESDETLFKKAAKIYNIPAAEWARRVLRKAAERDLATDLVLDPLSAVKKLSSLKAPIHSIAKMKEQGIKGRLK